MTVPKKGPRQKPAPNQTIQVFEQALHEHNCVKEDFRVLVDAHCSAERLMEAVASAWTHHANLRNDPGRMNARELETLQKKTRWVAKRWEQLFQTDFGKAVLEFAGRNPFHNGLELLNTPSRMLSLARGATVIHRGTANRRRPLYDDCLADLMEYVRLTTGKYHDREVSALVSFATATRGKRARGSKDVGEVYSETLAVWRSEHPGALKRAQLRLAQKH